MRWLYVPNESVEGDQVGPRMAFEKLFNEKLFSAYKAYSYLVRQKQVDCHSTALAEFLNTAREFEPDVIFIQHPGDDYPMDRSFLAALKSVPSQPRLVLYEEDAYGRYIKRINSTLKAVLAHCDICFLGGTGYFSELARKSGAKKIRYVTHSYDARRFGSEWQPTLSRKLDAVMVANLTCLKKIPWLYMPGGRSRKEVARRMHSYLGNRFVVYGNGLGWRGESYCAGGIDFDKQGVIIRDSWMSVNWGQFDEIPMYSSDRLPISLACGVPHITNYQPGYEHVFNAIPGLFIIKKPSEAVDVALCILGMSIDRRIELGLHAADYARKHLEVTKVYGEMVNVVREQCFMGMGG